MGSSEGVSSASSPATAAQIRELQAQVEQLTQRTVPQEPYYARLMGLPDLPYNKPYDRGALIRAVTATFQVDYPGYTTVARQICGESNMLGLVADAITKYKGEPPDENPAFGKKNEILAAVAEQRKQNPDATELKNFYEAISKLLKLGPNSESGSKSQRTPVNRNPYVQDYNYIGHDIGEWLGLVGPKAGTKEALDRMGAEHPRAPDVSGAPPQSAAPPPPSSVVQGVKVGPR